MLYSGDVVEGLPLLSTCLRTARRVLVFALLALFSAAPRAPAADAHDRQATLPRYVAERLQRVPIALLESRHPPDAGVPEQETSLWGRYRWYVAATGALILIEAILIIGLLLERAGRRRAELTLAERLRFESLLSELSARLIPVPLNDVDTEIERGLQRVGEFLRIDRASLLEYVPGGALVRIAWAVEEEGGPSPVIAAGQFPWTDEQLRRGDVVRFSRMDDLPEEAALDRQSYRNAGTRSSLSLPLRARGSMLGVLSFDSVRGERAWPDELLKRLQLLGEVIAGALERKRLELSLAERLRFETLLSEQTATFSSLSATDLDREIRRALRRISDFFKADWGSLAEFSHDGRTARITHSWEAEGAAPLPSTVALADIPWVTGRLQRGETVRFSRIEELPEEGTALDRRTYSSLGIKSHVEIPLRTAGALLGALRFSILGTERVWPDELVQRLQLLGEVFANILARRKSEIEAQQLRDDLSHVARVSTMGELAAALAHELNQPLTAILSNAQTAQDVLEANPVNLEEVREILADIVEDDARAGEVIHRLRSLLRKDALEYTSLDVNEMVGEVARLVSGNAALHSASVRLELAERLPPARGDRVQLQQVILNLILNGLDAVRESRTGDRVLVLQTARDGPAAVRISVRDSGPGIAEADSEHIFQAFYTTKTGGLGMGLAISRSIVEAHGGRLTAGNNQEGGATFSFTVPVADPER
jgi:signal transduction histidine kinase